MNILPLKERMKILRTHMPELDPQVRSRIARWASKSKTLSP